MKRNSGIIGPERLISVTEASGIFNLHDCVIARNDNFWPKVKKLSSITNSGSDQFHYEGEEKTFFVGLIGYEAGDIVYYSISSVTGSISDSDFVDNILTGSFTVNSNNQGQFAKTLVRDISNETESYKIQIRNGSVTGRILGESGTYNMPQPSYTLTPSSSTMNEGDTVTLTLTGTDTFEGTHYYSISGSSINSLDFSILNNQNLNTTSGNFDLPASGIGTFDVGARNDFNTEGTETFTVYARVNSISGPIVAQTNITINDTSQSLSVTCTPNVSSVDEGSSVTFTVNTTNFPSGTLNWKSVLNNEMEMSDLSATSGTVNISGSTGTIVITATSDGFTETGQTESFQIEILSPADNVASLVTSSAVTINDTSTGTSEPDLSRIVVGTRYDDDNNRGNSGSVYVYDLNGNNEVKITASDPNSWDRFGESVAVDNEKIVVGSPYSDPSGGDSGSVYVYDLDGTNEVKITASDGASDDLFGYSVAVGNNRIVVGARDDQDNGSDSGSVYTYNLDGTNQIKITASDGAANDEFGSSVAVGNNKIVVGAPRRDSPNNSGAVYVYDLNGTNEVQITASNAGNSDLFGYSVAVGNNKIVVGSPLDNVGGNDSGTVYVYDLDGTNEVQINASDTVVSGDRFGWSVAVGNNKIVVGAYTRDPNNTGAVYVYDLDGTNQVKITPSDGTNDDFFGYSVAVGNNKIVVGAYLEDDNGSNSGSVYVYNLDGTNEVKITSSDGAQDDFFGWSVATSI